MCKFQEIPHLNRQTPTLQLNSELIFLNPQKGYKQQRQEVDLNWIPFPSCLLKTLHLPGIFPPLQPVFPNSFASIFLALNVVEVKKKKTTGVFKPTRDQKMLSLLQQIPKMRQPPLHLYFRLKWYTHFNKADREKKWHEKERNPKYLVTCVLLCLLVPGNGN